MSSDMNRELITRCARSLRDEATQMLVEMTEIPADSTTAHGYSETVDFITGKLGEFATPQKVEVPFDYLENLWGKDLSRSRDYLPVHTFAPRTIVTTQIPGENREIGLHLTNSYDLYWGARKERAATVAQIIALKALAKSGVPMKKSVFLSATPDAYIGGEAGAGYLAASGIGRADAVLAGSLGGLDVITSGYKGVFWAKITAHGKSTHGSRPSEGKNAIDAMMVLQQRIAKLAEELSSKTIVLPIEPKHANAPTIAMCRIEANLDATFIPNKCTLGVDRRLNPGETLKEAKEELKNLVALTARETRCEFEIQFPHAAEPTYTPPDHPLHATLQRNLTQILGRQPREVVWSHYLSLHYFSTAWGSTAIAYAPGAVDHGNVQLDGSAPTVTDNQLMDAVEAMALTAYDYVNLN